MKTCNPDFKDSWNGWVETLIRFFVLSSNDLKGVWRVVNGFGGGDTRPPVSSDCRGATTLGKRYQTGVWQAENWDDNGQLKPGAEGLIKMFVSRVGACIIKHGLQLVATITNNAPLKNMKLIASERTPICLHALGQGLVDKLHSEGNAAYNACAVIAKTPAIREWLEKNDPKALEQIDAAL